MNKYPWQNDFDIKIIDMKWFDQSDIIEEVNSKMGAKETNPGDEKNPITIAGGTNQKNHQNHSKSWYLFQNWQKWSYWVYEQI